MLKRKAGALGGVVFDLGIWEHQLPQGSILDRGGGHSVRSTLLLY